MKEVLLLSIETNLQISQLKQEIAYYENKGSIDDDEDEEVDAEEIRVWPEVELEDM
eukprot:CAMPEP_0168611444 /NCGR_PEP_ID=MMETSP0449_2-20121227/2363_1 /TAXON_ID=1082188 /ORGANISM="Strombidium rassoulzadegani, Strain ras09" /LENGTH=55 /DNA_ID=CAMNT_0008651895 /DNA_START=412 /DNA_END=579 /DNA_ORIENTATION=-